MKDSEVLKKAKKYIKNGRTRFVCHAIGLSRSNGRIHACYCHLTAWVQTMLGKHYTYYNWLEANGYDTHSVSVKQGQLAWLDWMIAYCEAEEAKC